MHPDLATVGVDKRMPCIFKRDDDHGFFPEDLTGATIVAIGAPDLYERDLMPEGGGLIIDYKPRGSEVTKRIVFAFNEIGMWIEGEVETLTPPPTIG